MHLDAGTAGEMPFYLGWSLLIGLIVLIILLARKKAAGRTVWQIVLMSLLSMETVLLLDEEPCSYEQLAKSCSVSRQTAISDIRTLKKELFSSGIEIIGTSGQGLKTSGSEAARRSCMSCILSANGFDPATVWGYAGTSTGIFTYIFTHSVYFGVGVTVMKTPGLTQLRQSRMLCRSRGKGIDSGIIINEKWK